MKVIKLILASGWVVGTSANAPIHPPMTLYFADKDAMLKSFETGREVPFIYRLDGGQVIQEPTSPFAPPAQSVGYCEEVELETVVIGLEEKLDLPSPKPSDDRVARRTPRDEAHSNMLQVLGNYSRLSHLNNVDVGGGRLSNQLIVHFDDPQDATKVYVGIALSRED